MEALQLQQQLPCAGPPAAADFPAPASAAGLVLAIKPSSSWVQQDLGHVASLVQHRNRFVCMQLVTMVREQLSKVAAATAAGDAAALHAARFPWLATLSTSDSSTVLAAGLFYPRACSKDGADMPHVYVELICCNSPGKNLGSLLLQHIEQFVVDNCVAISEGFFGVSAAEAAAAGGALELQEPHSVSAPTVTSSSTADACNASTALEAPKSQRRSYSCLPVLLPEEVPSTAVLAAAACQPPAAAVAAMTFPGLAPSASSSSISSLASTISTSTAASSTASTGTAGSSALGGSLASSCASLASMQLLGPQLAAQLGPALDSLTCGCGSSAAAAEAGTGSTGTPSSGEVCGGGPVGAGGRGRLCKACKLIQGIKLLSVQSAQGFYTKCGYGAPDSSCEMFKPLPATCHSIGAALPHQAAF